MDPQKAAEMQAEYTKAVEELKELSKQMSKIMGPRAQYNAQHSENKMVLNVSHTYLLLCSRC
jgi:chaperonin cofactor prefoldin